MRVPLNLGEEGLEPLRKIQQELRDVRAQAGKPIPVESLDGSGEQLATTSASGSSAIRGLAIDLANATSPAQAFEAVIRRVSTAFGGLVAASAGFAIGSIIRRTLEDAAAGLEQLIDKSQELQQKFSNLSAPTTTFSQLTTAVQGAAAEIEALKKANEDLQSGFGFQVADYLSTFDLSAAANRETESGVENIRAGSTVAILAMMQRENELAKARTDEERALIGLQATRAQFREGAEKADPGAGGVAADRLFAAQDRRIAAEADREKSGTRAGNVTGRQLAPGSIDGLQEFQRAQDAAARALGPEFGPGTADAAAGGFRVDAANFALQQREEALRLSQQQASGLKGSFGASSLQRIGFASNEFFDTRRNEDPGKLMQQMVSEQKKTNKYLGDADGLYLQSSS
jgi:hypothetical protein